MRRFRALWHAVTKGATQRDDRGKTVAVADRSRAQWSLTMTGDTSLPPSLTPNVAGKRPPVLLGFALGAAGAVLPRVMPSPQFSLWAICAVGVLLGLAIAGVSQALHRVVTEGEILSIRGACLRDRRCGACCYPLEGSKAESDGCIVCSECGAAWRADQLGRRTRIRAEPDSGIRARLLGKHGPMIRRIAVSDDRHVYVPLADPWSSRFARAGKASALGRRLTTAPAVLRRGDRQVLPGVLGVLILWCILWAAPGAVHILMIPAAALACFLLFKSWFERSIRDRSVMIRSMLAQRVCPSCAGDLHDAAFGADGLAECPDCGAAWRTWGQRSPSPETTALPTITASTGLPPM